ncbi:MAG: IclR family transcriptional regulator [Burkholderiales bacterium]|nr:IclR family transcriptional regulator [Burkholderiales bacterium]
MLRKEPAPSATRKTVTKAMQILHVFAEDETQVSLATISERLGMHKSVASRLVSCLCEWRMLERDPDSKRIRLGMGAWQLGMRVANQNIYQRLALPILGHLAETTRHSAYASVLDGAEMLVVAAVPSPDALRVILQLGDRRPLHATAGGKVLLAHMPAAQRQAILEKRGLPALTRATLTSAKALEAQLAAIRRSGIAWNEGESAIGVGGAAAGVFNADGGIVGTISSVFPQNVVAPAQRATLAHAVRAAAAELSAALGFRPAAKISRKNAHGR